MLWHIACGLIAAAITLTVTGLWAYGMCLVADKTKR